MKTKTNLLAGGILIAGITSGFGEPVIIRRPTSQSVSLGANVQFQVSATSSIPPVTYQWRFASSVLAGKTNASLSLTNVQLGSAGDYDAIASDSSGSVTSSIAHLQIDPTFTKITSGAIVGDRGYSAGGTWGDYIYRNTGEGTFTAVTNSALVTDHSSSLGCVWGDYDNDGYLDLFVCSGTGHNAPTRPNRLYHNNGDGTFTQVTTGSIATDRGESASAAWGDYDNDGYMDLFVVNLDVYGLGSFLYHNNGDGTFTRITNDIVATNVGNARSCAWGDYDNDGFLDLFVTNADFTPDGYPSALVNFLYHNNGDGAFTRVTTGSPVNDYNDSWGCSWTDYDRERWLSGLVCIQG